MMEALNSTMIPSGLSPATKFLLHNVSLNLRSKGKKEMSNNKTFVALMTVAVDAPKNKQNKTFVICLVLKYIKTMTT